MATKRKLHVKHFPFCAARVPHARPDICDRGVIDLIKRRVRLSDEEGDPAA
eukprot:CAMPEP_0194505452 /NCGR_PEP_ID=MMETSP0253-20130528/32030_1 /TAXON_ID=2966 /ORGANISM="Noctiluca scintillans" /LENGTH=50 /DNA_ID=CAMNT_0039348005 /DNA_START=27 /DNA_END=176 /DNA_ORIENTATION=+